MVLFVIGLVLAISAPALRGYFSSRQTADIAADVMTATSYARSTAIANGAICRLNVDPQSGEYWLTIQQGGDFVAVDGDMGKRVSPPDGMTISLCPEADQSSSIRNTPANLGQTMSLGGPRRQVQGATAKNYLQFYPTGRVDTGTIEITGSQGQAYRVVAESATESFRVIVPTEAP